MKIATFVIVLFTLTCSLIVGLNTVEVANGQITNFYGSGYDGAGSGLNYCSFYITMYSPDEQITYVNVMPLKFNLTWTEYPNFPIPALYGYYAYRIDNGPFIEVKSNQSDSDAFYQTSKNNFTLNPNFSYTVDISHLERGHHNIMINASLYNYNSYSPPSQPPAHFYFTLTTSPYAFSVEKSAEAPNPSPIPTITPLASMSASLVESASALNFGDRINFSVSVEGGRAPYSYSWFVDDQLAEAGSSPFYAIDSISVGSHHVYVEIKDSDNNSATTLIVEFNVLPASSSTISPTTSTYQTTLEPSPSSSILFVDVVDYGTSPFVYILGIAVLVIAVVVGLLVYFKRRRG